MYYNVTSILITYLLLLAVQTIYISNLVKTLALSYHVANSEFSILKNYAF